MWVCVCGFGCVWGCVCGFEYVCVECGCVCVWVCVGVCVGGVSVCVWVFVCVWCGCGCVRETHTSVKMDRNSSIGTPSLQITLSPLESDGNYSYHEV